MRLKRFTILMVLFTISSNIISQDTDKHKYFEEDGYQFPYDLSDPDKKWELPKELMEVSGLSFIDQDRIACVQDEKGNIYIFNLKTGEIKQKIEFGNDGDYEGIEVLQDDAWVLKSNGSLYEVKDFLISDNAVAKQFKTELSKKNDAEGLAYDQGSHSLLIACKGHPFLDEKEGKEFKSVYIFDLKTKKLDLSPIMLIQMDSIKFYKNYNTMAMMGIELLAYFDSSKGDLSFQPSGIAIHPVTGNFYIMGSVGNLMMVFSREGNMLAMIKLRSKYYNQPEGICFDPNGTLYISNEGEDSKKPTILKFKPKF